MDSFNPVPPIRPIIPDIARIERLPRVERDEHRQPPPDDQDPPPHHHNQQHEGEDEYSDAYDVAWQDAHLPILDPHLPASEEQYASEQYAAEEELTSTPPDHDRRGPHDPLTDPDDDPGPHIDITA
jgi:hypothetical protein